MTLYIARHAYRLDFDENGTEESPTGLPRDPQISEFGEDQARELANYFKGVPEDQRPTAIFSSPYYRCLQTAQPTATELDIPIYVEHGLSEWYSPVKQGTGLHPRPSDASALKVYFPEIDESWPSVWYPSRKGEGVAALHDRLAGFITDFVPEVQRRFSGAHDRVLFITHAGTAIALTRELIGDRGLMFPVACCSLTVVDRKDAAATDLWPTIVGDWTPRLLGDCTHLKDGPQRAWGFHMLKVAANGEVIEKAGVPGTENEKDEPVGSQINLDHIYLLKTPIYFPSFL